MKDCCKKMREVMRNTFLFFVGLFLFLILYKIVGRLETEFLTILGLILSLFLAITISFLFEKLLSKIPYKTFIQAIISFSIVIFLIYQLFAPYFYSDNQLAEIGKEKIELLYQALDKEKTDEERKEMIKKLMVDPMASHYLTVPYSREKLVKIDVQKIERTYYLFSMTVILVVDNNGVIEEKTQTFDLEHDYGFKILGIFKH